MDAVDGKGKERLFERPMRMRLHNGHCLVSISQHNTTQQRQITAISHHVTCVFLRARATLLVRAVELAVAG